MEGKAKEALTKFQASKSDMDIIVNNNKMLLNSLTIEWLDSLGIYVYVDPVMSQGIYYWRAYIHYFECEGNLRQEQYYASRQEATEAAIKKAVEIYNDKYK